MSQQRSERIVDNAESDKKIDKRERAGERERERETVVVRWDKPPHISQDTNTVI